MASKKVPIHFSDKDQNNLGFLGKLFNISPDDYGGVPKIVKGSISLTKSMLEHYSNLIPDLKGADLDFFLSSIKTIKEKRSEVKT